MEKKRKKQLMLQQYASKPSLLLFLIIRSGKTARVTTQVERMSPLFKAVIM